ncbi:MAG: peptidylprolyl isomerase [Myxococcales bacterium]|nr:peptidylprolyl isomerase [Myxococcales bacterium]MBK7194074.1 peptidylprolyl isomerase [Myxococcales bacterium]MBP6843666.1 peptidylprolyl isomerase [Kofleriaceae bacterium]
MRALPLSSRWCAALALTTSLFVGACQRDKPKNEAGGSTGATPTITVKDLGQPGPDGVYDIDSKDILARTKFAPSVDVKHVLIAWDKLADVYGGRMDPRAQKRTNEQAAILAKTVAAQLKAAPDRIDELVKLHGEDPGAAAGEPYQITADAPFVPEFKNLGLRLEPKEAGIVKTRFGYHVIERMTPPPPDPLESAEILARPAGTETVMVKHVLIGWKDVPMAKQRPVDPRAQNRVKADADKLAQEVLAKAKAEGADMAALMKEYSEDPGSKDSGKAYDVGPTTGFVQPFKDLALRLKMNEAGLVKTAFGWHVIKRVSPPPPDALESADVLARAPVTDKCKVKHILLGFDALNAGDERGKKRTRADLDALVAKTVAALKKGDKIEPLMKSLSEDPGSAANGNSYDVTPDAGLVAPFKNLSLRLNVGEVGVVKTDFGFHIIQRTE